MTSNSDLHYCSIYCIDAHKHIDWLQKHEKPYHNEISLKMARAMMYVPSFITLVLTASTYLTIIFLTGDL